MVLFRHEGKVLDDAADLDSSGVPVMITLPTAGDILDMMPTAPVTVWWEQRHSSYQCMGGEQGNELVSQSRLWRGWGRAIHWKFHAHPWGLSDLEPVSTCGGRPYLQLASRYFMFLFWGNVSRLRTKTRKWIANCGGIYGVLWCRLVIHHILL